jgi:Phosphodiester glycosidase
MLLCAALLASRAAGEDLRYSEWNSLVPGLWHRPWQVSTDEGPAVDGYVFRADPRILRMTVLDARRADRSVARVAVMRQESQAYLVVNGGFFDENAQPLGLVVGDGKQTSPLRKVDQGVFLISMGKPMILHSRDPLPEPLDTALQSGPRLVVDGRALQLKPQTTDGGLGCWSALNLDGGPSTQLSVATPGFNLEVDGGWGVPNGLAVLPRSTAPQAPLP